MGYPLHTNRLGMPPITIEGLVAELAALDHLAKFWPQVAPDALSHAYPTDAGSLDTWARAAVCHAVIDVLEQRETVRQPAAALGSSAEVVYFHFYWMTVALQKTVR